MRKFPWHGLQLSLGREIWSSGLEEIGGPAKGAKRTAEQTKNLRCIQWGPPFFRYDIRAAQEVRSPEPGLRMDIVTES